MTFVKDTYNGSWLDDEEAQLPESFPRVRPADYLVYKFVHFECALKPETRIHDGSRKEGKALPSGQAPTELKGGTVAEKQSNYNKLPTSIN